MQYVYPRTVYVTLGRSDLHCHTRNWWYYVPATFLQDKSDRNMSRVIFLSLLLRDRLLPISFNDSKSILNRQLDELKHFARAKVSNKTNTPTGKVCHVFKGCQNWICLFILKVANIRCFILIKCSEQKARFKKYAIMS